MNNPSTPASSSDLFVTPQGASVSIFVQTTDMGNVRMRLLKVLKREGASICSDPKLADIVVVRQDTNNGRGLIRTWAGDQVVLHYQWIDACARAGRMLEGPDGWGGFIAEDDGGLADNFEPEVAEQGPEQGAGLPTPRQTRSPATPPLSTSQEAGAPFVNDIDPLHFLQAISDELLNNSDRSLRQNGRRLQTIIPNLFDGSMEDVEMAAPDAPLMSDKARGKRKDTSKVTPSRMSSASIPPVTPTRSSASTPDPLGALFMTNNKSLKFYVQPDTYQRKDLVKSIRKNGGALVSHVQEADFAILYAKAVTAASRKDYQSSLASAMADKIPAIRGQFVEDCIARNKLLDYKPYVFIPPTKRKRTASAQSTESSEDDEPLSQQVKQTKPEKPSSKPAKLSKGSPSRVKIPTPQVKRTMTSSAASGSRPASKSSTVLAKPAPKKERVFFRYTESELELALELAFKYWEEDYRKSDTQLAKLLHSKMGHHTFQSWQTYLNQTKKKDFEEVKKKASIKCRKRMDQEKAEQERLSRASSLAAESQGGASRRSSAPSIQQISPPPPPQVPLPAPRTIEQDVETFADFLAFKGGDQFDPNDPSSAYRALSALSPWRSGEGWGAFWTAEWQRIQPLYQQKLEQAEATQQKNRDDIFNEGEVSLGDQLRNY